MTDEFSPIGSPSRNGPHFMEIAFQKCDVKCERVEKVFSSDGRVDTYIQIPLQNILISKIFVKRGKFIFRIQEQRSF